MARPLARYAARRISFDGDGSDTADGLSFLFAAAAYISRVIGVDLDEPEGDADFDHELMEAIESEVAEAIKARRPAKKASKPRKAKAKAPAADQAPDQ
jgi:hypothetical protein